MTLSEGILRQKLAQPFRYYQRVASTNDLAKTWLLDGAPDGAVVIADEQARGRGRKGRIWRTPPGTALAVSIVMRPAAARIARINMIGALSVFDLAAQVGCEDIGIKWPNDIQVQGKKISGILVENVWMQGSLHGAVLGIGVNIRIDFSQTDLRETAISLEDVTGFSLNRADLIRSLLERVAYWYQRIESDDLFDTWRSRLSMLGCPVVAEGVRGRALDVTAAGGLLVEDEFDALHEIITGEITAVTQERSAE